MRPRWRCSPSRSRRWPAATPSSRTRSCCSATALCVGPLVGAALGYVTLWIRKRLANPGLETVQGLVVPFAAFIAAEELHASGVLAVVVAGFVVGSGTLGAGYQTRLQERYVWNSVDVLLEAFVFAYIGLHLRFVLEDLREAHESLAEVAIASIVVLLIVLVIRPLSVFAMFGRDKLSRHVESRYSVPVPAAGGRGALGTRRRASAPGRWRSRIDQRIADVAGERRGVLDRHAWRGDAGGRGGDPGDHGQPASRSRNARRFRPSRSWSRSARC